MRRGGAILSGLALAAALAGCGYSRAAVPSGSPAAPDGFHTVSFPAQGLALEAPRNWTLTDERSPLVMTLTSGDAVVALWRYARGQPLPRGRAQMRLAMQRLIAAVRARQPDIQVVRGRVVRLHGRRGIELNALERIKGSLRRVRSTHLYLGQTEIVLEEYAPVDLFHSVDHLVFSPVRRSLRLVGT